MLWVIKVASYSPPPPAVGPAVILCKSPSSQFPCFPLSPSSTLLPSSHDFAFSIIPTVKAPEYFFSKWIPPPPRASSRRGVFIKSLQVLTKYCCRHWCSIMEWNMTQDAGTENCSPPDCCSRRGKGGVRKGSNLGKWGRRQKNVKSQRKKYYPIQPFPAYYPLSRGSDWRPD